MADITGANVVGANMVKDGEVEVVDGKYTSVKVSDDFLNAMYAKSGSGSVTVPNKDPEGPMMDVSLDAYKGFIATYHFNHFIDSRPSKAGRKPARASGTRCSKKTHSPTPNRSETGPTNGKRTRR